MAKYIDADKMLEEYKRSIYDTTDLAEMLYYMPAADVEDVCRCEHCSKSGEHPNGRWCIIHQTVVQNSDYCSWGARKDD